MKDIFVRKDSLVYKTKCKFRLHCTSEVSQIWNALPTIQPLQCSKSFTGRMQGHYSSTNSNVPYSMMMRFDAGIEFDKFFSKWPKSTCEANSGGGNSSFIFIVCVESVPFYHFKLAYM